MQMVLLQDTIVYECVNDHLLCICYVHMLIYSSFIVTEVDEAHGPKQHYVKNGHTLPVGSNSGGGQGIESVRSPAESDLRVNPAWLPHPDDRRGRAPSDGERRGGLGFRQDEGRRGGRSGGEEWKPNLAWQVDEARRGGRANEKRPGLTKAPSEDCRRTRPETEWKPTLPRHASAEEGRGRRGESGQLSSVLMRHARLQFWASRLQT